MTAVALLAELSSLGIRLAAEDGRLRVNAPKGALTDELKARIAARKSELLELLSRPGHLGPAPLARVARDRPLPLSFFQERLWLLQRLDPTSTDYNLVTGWERTGLVEPERLLAAIRAVVARHEILRASFRDLESVPSIVLLPAPQVPIEVHDLRGAPEPERSRLLQAGVDAALHTPFDLAAGPARFAVYLLAADRAVTVVATHHIAVDAWSLRLLAGELDAAYEGRADGEPPPLQYVDYAAWQRGADDDRAIAADLAWWKKRLAGIPPVSTFPPDRPRTDRAAGAAHGFTLDRALSDRVRELARQEGATVYMALVAACAAALQWHTGQDDLVLGSPMGDRERPELEGMIGPFVNLLVLRLDLSDDPSFAELLRRARAMVLDAHEHRRVPFEKLVEQVKPVRSPELSPIFQVAVVHHNAPGATKPILGGGAIFDLTWFVHEDEGRLAGALEYRSDLYTPRTMARLAARLEAVLTAAAAEPHRRLSSFSLILEDERDLVLGRFNATTTQTDRATFIEQLERQAARTPDAPAVVFEGAALTYAELDRRATRLGRTLASLGVGPGVVIGLCLPRSLEMVVALLAIHKAGGAYLPLDPDFPVDRLSFMLSDSGARALVTDGAKPAGLVIPEGVNVIDLDVFIVPDGDAPLARQAGPTDLAYILYTSGSTGRPKGVRIQHAALSNFLASMRVSPGLAPTDVLAAVTTLSFDIAGLELYLPLTVGARIELLGKTTAADGAALASALERSGATVMQATPSTWRLLVEAGWRGPAGFRALCGGEPLPHELARALLDRTGELWNLYGPTETTIWSTSWRVEPGTGPILVGRPIANTQIYVLGRSGQLLPPGIPGEIWIAGDGVAEGYHGRPELTDERFRPDPFAGRGRMYRTGDLGRWHADGTLEHLGRVDQQVKVRGFRIELGEIEAVLAAHASVRQAVVVARETSPGDVRLVAYVVYQPGEDLTVSEVRRHLRRDLPDYMVPSVVVAVDEIPLTPNGKVDRAALPDPFKHAVTAMTHEPPAPGMEQRIAEIWREILKVERVGAEDNFFEIGGHSLLSLRVAHEIEKRCGWRMDPRILFFQNLRQIAAAASLNVSAR